MIATLNTIDTQVKKNDFKAKIWRVVRPFFEVLRFMGNSLEWLVPAVSIMIMFVAGLLYG